MLLRSPLIPLFYQCKVWVHKDDICMWFQVYFLDHLPLYYHQNIIWGLYNWTSEIGSACWLHVFDAVAICTPRCYINLSSPTLKVHRAMVACQVKAMHKQHIRTRDSAHDFSVKLSPCVCVAIYNSGPDLKNGCNLWVCMIWWELQSNLRTKDTLGTGLLSFVQRLSLTHTSNLLGHFGNDCLGGSGLLRNVRAAQCAR